MDNVFCALPAFVTNRGKVFYKMKLRMFYRIFIICK